MNQDLYQDTLYGQRVGNYSDYGLYWVKKNVKPDVIVEFHLDAASPQASGGHVIVSNKFPADDIDKALSSALGKTVGKIRGVTPRNDLLNANVTGQLNLNYRLIELGFITSKKTWTISLRTSTVLLSELQRLSMVDKSMHLRANLPAKDNMELGRHFLS